MKQAGSKKGQLLSVLRDAGSPRKFAVGGVVQIKNLPRCTRRDALERRRSTSRISDSRVGIDRHVDLRACGTVIDAKTYGLNARQGQIGDAGRVAEHRRASIQPPRLLRM